MLHVPTPSQTKFAQRHRNFHESISARAAKIAPPVKAPDVQRKHSFNPVPYWRGMWFYDLVTCGETYIPGKQQPRRDSVKTIQLVVAEYYGVKVSDILSQRRTREVVIPRHVAMYLTKELTGRSYPDIGRRFGHRDHTTAISAVRRIEYLLERDEALRSQVRQISENIARAA